MAYRFRIAFRLADGYKINTDAEGLDLASGADGQDIKLVSGEGDGKFLKECTRLVLKGGPFQREEEARSAAGAARNALLYYAVCTTTGIDLGREEPAGGLTNAGKAFLEEKLGTPVLNDRLGTTIFEAAPPPTFIRIDAKAEAGKSATRFTELFQQSYQDHDSVSDKVDLAAELFSLSRFEITTRARFLITWMSLEVLVQQGKRSEAAQAVIDQLVVDTRASRLPKEEIEPLINALGNLKRESIRVAGKRPGSGKTLCQAVREQETRTIVR